MNTVTSLFTSAVIFFCVYFEIPQYGIMILLGALFIPLQFIFGELTSMRIQLNEIKYINSNTYLKKTMKRDNNE
jgi:hypothetical protein